MSKLTSRELVSTLIELELDRKFLEQTQGDDPGFVEEVKPIDEAIVKIKKEMTNKASGLESPIPKFPDESTVALDVPPVEKSI